MDNEQTFAMLLSSGTWARVYTRQTMGGDKQEIEEVSINSATVMRKQGWRKFEEQGVLVPVRETRTVTIVVGGTPDETTN